MRLPPAASTIVRAATALAAAVLSAGLLSAAAPTTAAASVAAPTTAAASVAVPTTAAAASARPTLAPARLARPSGVWARGGELANALTGRRLWSRGLNVRRPMGSITKVMTALVVIRAGDLERKIRISDAVVRYGSRDDASSAGLRAGDVLTARQLLEGMLVPSGCDAAFALATAYGPGWKTFVAKMNATARQLGMTGTHFANFDGLPWPTGDSTYSTPRDLVILGNEAMKSVTFRNIVRQRAHWIGADAQHHRYYWRTTNLLLGSYPGAVGIKTGSTPASGYCLLFEARRNGRSLIGVVLNSSDTNPGIRFAAAARLLNWGFTIIHAPRPR